MEMTKKEFLVQDDSRLLKEFIRSNCEHLDSLVKDSKTAQVGLIRNRHGDAVAPVLFLTPVNPPPPAAGGLHLRGGVLRRKPEDHTAVHVLPHVRALHQRLQGECVGVSVLFILHVILDTPSSVSFAGFIYLLLSVVLSTTEYY